MKAYPSDDGRFVKRQTSVKDWPVFSDKAGAISANIVAASSGLPTGRNSGALSTPLPTGFRMDLPRN
jgi:hypothetical protein